MAESKSEAMTAAEATYVRKSGKKILALFDVDGTLTIARGEVTPEMTAFMASLREQIVIGTVGGSDFPKQQEQLGDDVTSKFDFCFAENGLTAYQAGVALPSQSLVGYLGEDRLKEIVNWTLHYIADLDIPVKRGTFIEFRNGMLNISPIGRNCSRPERNEFEAFDKGAKVRETMVGKMQELFGEKMGLQFSIGGQISFDVFPKGWDKTYCLKHLEAHAFDEIHFFGDKTFEGGNDYEIFHHPATNGHAVTSPEDTMKQCKELFF
eukprot:g2795.t1